MDTKFDLDTGYPARYPKYGILSNILTSEEYRISDYADTEFDIRPDTGNQKKLDIVAIPK